MTPDKVEEIVEKICDFDFENKLWSDKGFDEFKDLIRTTLTQHHQDLMSEVVEKLEGIKILPKMINGEMDLYPADKVHNQALTEAQTIIKSK